MTSNAKPKKVPAVEEVLAHDEAVQLHADLFDDEINEAIAQPGYLGFSVRELGIVAAGLVVTLFSFLVPGNPFHDFGFSWVLASGVVAAAAVLVLARRLAPQVLDRVGSLSIDQFASVAFSVSAVVWFGSVFAGIAAGVAPGYATWLALVGALAGVALTVGAPHIPGLRDDFIGRPDALANVVAAPARPITAVPRPVAPPTVEDIVTVEEADEVGEEELEEELDEVPPAPPAPPAKD